MIRRLFLALFLSVAIVRPAAAGPVFFAVLSAGGGFFAAVGATALGSFFSTVLGRILISAALSRLATALAPKPK